MPRYLEYDWIVSSSESNEICLLQDSTSGIPLILNGSLSVKTGKKAVIKNNLRYINIQSDNNLSGVTFTISGIQLGVPVTWSGSGPNNNKVMTDILFDTITSVVTDNDAAQVSVGISSVGWFVPISINPYTAYMNYLLYVACNDLDYIIFSCALKRDSFIPFEHYIPYLVSRNSTAADLSGYVNSHESFQFLAIQAAEKEGTSSCKIVFNQPSTGS